MLGFLMVYFELLYIYIYIYGWLMMMMDLVVIKDVLELWMVNIY